MAQIPSNTANFAANRLGLNPADDKGILTYALTWDRLGLHWRRSGLTGLVENMITPRLTSTNGHTRETKTHPIPAQDHPILAAYCALDFAREDLTWALQDERGDNPTHVQYCFLELEQVAHTTTQGRLTLLELLHARQVDNAQAALQGARHTRKTITWATRLGLVVNYTGNFTVPALAVACLDRRGLQQALLLLGEKHIRGAESVAYQALWAQSALARAQYQNLAPDFQLEGVEGEFTDALWDTLLSDLDLYVSDPIAWVNAGKNRHERRTRGAGISLETLAVLSQDQAPTQEPSEEAPSVAWFWWIRTHFAARPAEELAAHLSKLTAGEKILLTRTFMAEDATKVLRMFQLSQG